MKNVFLPLKEKEHQKAILTVLVISMLMILFLLLVSLKTPVDGPNLLEEVQEVEIEFTEVESSAMQMAERSNSAKTENSKVITQEEPVFKQIVTEVNVEPIVDESLHFVKSNKATKGNDGEFFKNNEIAPVRKPKEVVANREVVKKPILSANSQEEGTIAMEIWVDAAGNIIKTRYLAEQSTSGSRYLISLAKKAAFSMKYEEKKGTVMEYVGWKAFEFKKV